MKKLSKLYVSLAVVSISTLCSMGFAQQAGGASASQTGSPWYVAANAGYSLPLLNDSYTTDQTTVACGATCHFNIIASSEKGSVFTMLEAGYTFWPSFMPHNPVKLGLAVDIGSVKETGVTEYKFPATPAPGTQMDPFNYADKAMFVSPMVTMQVAVFNLLDQRLQWWLMAGVGTTYAKASDFSISKNQTDPDSDDKKDFGYKDNSRWCFAYAVGTSMTYALNQDWQVSMSYQFLDAGYAQFAKGTAAYTPLPKVPLKNNIVTFGLSFHF